MFPKERPEHTVDGRNPAAVDRWFSPLSIDVIGFYTSQGG